MILREIKNIFIKNRLTEGVDYKRYEWLKGDGSAYINTKVSDLSTIESIYCYFIGNGIVTQRVFGRDREGNSRFVTQQAYNQIRVYTDGDLSTDLVSPNNEEGYILIDYKNATAETKYSQATIVKNTITTGPNLILFGNNWGTSISNFFTGKIHKFEIKNILSFIPCKLLQPIPPYMDANNIDRNAGECGMYDSISGKFYGNVANSGTFTVEGDVEPEIHTGLQQIYQNKLIEGVDFVRKEWLKGDGTAYIDTLHLANEGLLWETHVSNLSFKKYFVWNRVVPIETPSISLYHSIATNGTVRVQNNYTNSIELQNQINYDYIVATNSNGVVVNGVQYIRQSASEGVSNKSIKLFYCDIDESSKKVTIISNGGNSQDVKCAYFRFIDANGTTIQDLVPCQLLRSIPRNLDTQCKERVAGECGMIDLISGKFYGNVASSGTFTVENDTENNE